MRAISALICPIVMVSVCSATLLPAEVCAGELIGIDGKCLDVPNGNATDGTPVEIWQCHGGPNQQWTISNGAVIGIGGKCLDVPNSNTTDGTPVEIWQCHGGSNQQWSFH